MRPYLFGLWFIFGFRRFRLFRSNLCFCWPGVLRSCRFGLLFVFLLAVSLLFEVPFSLSFPLLFPSFLSSFSPLFSLPLFPLLSEFSLFPVRSLMVLSLRLKSLSVSLLASLLTSLLARLQRFQAGVCVVVSLAVEIMVWLSI